MTDVRGHHLHFDCASGAAGDMFLGAMLQAGVPRQVIDAAVAAVGVELDRVSTREVVKGGITAVDLKVREDADYHGHASYTEIVATIRDADIDDRTRELALEIFARIARAEAKIHGVELDAVHFHEIGSTDSFVDIVGAAAAIAWLAPPSVSASVVVVGEGTVATAHGKLPVPSPAALEILREASAPIAGGGVARELCTPTGAAILATIVEHWGGAPAMVPVSVGYGAGDIDLEDRPNVMRVTIGKRERPKTTGVVTIEANLDDMTPEHASYLAERLLEAGALDVWWAPIVMKKSRPGFKLGVLASAHEREALVELILRESTTLGVRYHESERTVLDRESRTVATEFGDIAVKVAMLDGSVLRAVAEFDACSAAARAHGVPLRDVYAAAEAASRKL